MATNDPGAPTRKEGLTYLQKITVSDLKYLSEPVLIQSKTSGESFAVLVPVAQYMEMQKKIRETIDG